MSINRRMDNKDVVPIYTQWNTTQPLKRNKVGSFAETWMDLETVIQNEIGQKEKNKYHTLMPRCGI